MRTRIYMDLLRKAKIGTYDYLPITRTHALRREGEKGHPLFFSGMFNEQTIYIKLEDV